MITQNVILLVLLLLSAFFSGSETAFFSLTRLELKNLAEENDATSQRITLLLERPERLLISILLGNNLVNIAIATIAAMITHTIIVGKAVSPLLALIVDIIIVTFVILILSEITPKVIAVKNHLRFTRVVAAPLQLFMLLFWPVIRPLELMMGGLVRQVGKRGRIHLSESELKTLVEVGEEQGALEEEEKEMISSIFEFGRTQVREIMIPRIDVIAVIETTSFDELVRVVTSNGHSRIPVFREKMDNIIGILYAKDLIPYLLRDTSDFSMATMLREPYFAPDSKQIDDLLRDFQQQKIHMAVVVDEYGGTAGIVTLEDIIEEIVGEIQDEFDSEGTLFRKMGDGTYLIDARLSISDLNEMFDEDLLDDSSDYETLGGFIFDIAGEVPEVANHFDSVGYRFTVLTMEGHRLGLIKVEKTPATEATDEEGD
ncbi:MAG: HlyC/CorC family transporter [Candidatus Delongbacteria bacterium]|nr:HlyC/CorC family transporter [bacterium]MBL7033652.1 HlyC/CorC family transporter [Candidatus Delongbacteria bacterium]